MTIGPMRLAALSLLVLLAGCARERDVAPGRFQARVEGAAAETVRGPARFCWVGRGGTVAMLSDDGEFGLLLQGLEIRTGQAAVVDVLSYEPSQPRTVAADLFVPPALGGDQRVTGGTVRFTAADRASVRGTFQLSAGPPPGAAGGRSPGVFVEGSFSLDPTLGCGG